MEPLIAGFVSVTAFGGIHLSTALGGPLLADFVFVTALRGIHFVDRSWRTALSGFRFCNRSSRDSFCCYTSSNTRLPWRPVTYSASLANVTLFTFFVKMSATITAVRQYLTLMTF